MNNPLNTASWNRMHRTAAIAEDCVCILGGRMTQWEEKPHITGQWLFTEIRVNRRVIPVAVSGGGVIQVNRSPYDPRTGMIIENTTAALSAINHHIKRQEAQHA